MIPGRSSSANRLQVTASVRQEDEFQPSLGGVRVGDSITVEYGNGYTKDYRVKGIYSTGWSPVDSAAYRRPGPTWNRWKERRSTRRIISRSRAKPGYSEKFIKNELLQYGVGVTGKCPDHGRPARKEHGTGPPELCHHQHGLPDRQHHHHDGRALHRHHHQDHQQPQADRDPARRSAWTRRSSCTTTGSRSSSSAVLGIILGIIITFAARRLHGRPPHRDSRMVCNPVPDTHGLLTNSVILFCAAVVAGYVPAYQVSREDIQTAMRA